MLHERLVKSAFEVVCHGGYIMSQLAGVTIPQALFNNTLRLIVRLRTLPGAAMTATRSGIVVSQLFAGGDGGRPESPAGARLARSIAESTPQTAPIVACRPNAVRFDNETLSW